MPANGVRLCRTTSAQSTEVRPPAAQARLPGFARSTVPTGCSLAAKAPALGAGDRWFESNHPEKNLESGLVASSTEVSH